jgi:phage terminase large subunit
MNAIDLTMHLPQKPWQPRPHQKKLWRFLMRGGKRAVAVWHRRAGKDEILLHATAVAMLDRVGNYWHCLPLYEQGRKAVWTAINPHTGRRRIDEAFPVEMRANTNDSTMFIRFHNGSTWQVVGSDSYNQTVGSSAAGIVFSEYALSNPSAWAYYRPMVEENDGWAAFITTPRGRNHALTLFQHAQRTPGWFAELLTAEDTGAISPEALAEALAEYVALYGEAGQAMFDQELLCSFNAAILGSFYAREMADVRKQERVRTDVVALEGRPVSTCWDLGVSDDTAIWFWQAQGAQLVLLDFYSASGVGLEHYADIIKKKEQEHGWIHGDDWVPHDAKVKEWGSGRTRVETMASIGLKPILVPMATVDDGINAARRALPLCVFHQRCEDGGIAALEQYRREWDDDKKCFRASAVHDWTSHPADAFRYLAMSWKPAPRIRPAEPAMDGWRIPPPREPGRGGLRL